MQIHKIQLPLRSEEGDFRTAENSEPKKIDQEKLTLVWKEIQPRRRETCQVSARLLLL